jgi:hypothetical protein
MNTERDNWIELTPEDATDAELGLVHKIMGDRPKHITPAQWRDNMRACAKSIRSHVAAVRAGQVGTLNGVRPYEHPKTIDQFEEIYRHEYHQELASDDRWIAWCKVEKDDYGVNFHQGKRSATIFNNIKMEQLLRVLKGEQPNA